MFVAIREFTSRFDAEVVAQALEVAGIPFFIQSDDTAIGFGTLSGATLKVPSDRVGEALSVMEAFEGDDAPD